MEPSSRKQRCYLGLALAGACISISTGVSGGQREAIFIEKKRPLFRCRAGLEAAAGTARRRDTSLRDGRGVCRHRNERSIGHLACERGSPSRDAHEIQEQRRACTGRGRLTGRCVCAEESSAALAKGKTACRE